MCGPPCGCVTHAKSTTTVPSRAVYSYCSAPVQFMSWHAVINTLSYRSVIPKLYALCFSCRFATRRDILMAKMAKLIEADLGNGGYHAGTPPPPEFVKHTERVLRLTLRRPLHTKGRQQSEGHDEKWIESLCTTIQSLANGDIRLSCVSHFCQGCCSGMRDCAAKLAHAVVTFVEELGIHFAKH